MTRLAVVVLNWNGSADTIACVSSLVSSTRRPDWIVVVDNASTDDSLSRFADVKLEAVLLRSEANLGFAGGNNIGIRWALEEGADAIWLLNNDAVAAPTAIEHLVSAFEANPGAGLLGSRIYKANGRDLQCWGGGWISLRTGRAREFAHEVSVKQLDYISGCSLFIPRNTAETCGLLDEGFFMYFEDAEYSLRVRAAGLTLAIAEKAAVSHKGGASRKASRREAAWRTQSLLRVLKEHSPHYLASVTVSSTLRATSLVLHGRLRQLRYLLTDLARYARNPDWRAR